MSSLAAARADNFYYGPGFDPDMHKTLNKYNGQHPLRERAAKLDQGILVIRFEMPFNIWCGKCNEMVAKGERFNAEKKAIGMYHSTKILQFSMRHHCGCTIVVQTDPKNAEYLVVDGGRRKAEDYSAEDAGVIELADDQQRALLDDPFYRLEHGEGLKVKARTEAERVAALWDEADERHRDNYSLNKKLRAQLRSAKKEDAQLDERRKELHLPEHIRLLPEDENDAATASLTFFAAGDAHRSQRSAEAKRRAIETESIFSPRAGAAAAAATTTAAAGGTARGTAAGTSGRAAGGTNGSTVPGRPNALRHNAEGAGAPAGASRGFEPAGSTAGQGDPVAGRSVSAPPRLPVGRQAQSAGFGGLRPASGLGLSSGTGGGGTGGVKRGPGGGTAAVKRPSSVADRAQLLAKRQRLLESGVKLGLAGGGSVF